MFEHWSERRRRWFLITFSATAWALFCSSLASLTPHLSRGGLGPDTFHLVETIGTIAVWTALWAMFKLRMGHWIFAVLFGLTLSTALVDFGLRDHVRAGIWDIECERGSGDACHHLADYYANGTSPLHGWLDAAPLHARACILGGAMATESCRISDSLGLRDRTDDGSTWNGGLGRVASDAVCEDGSYSRCLRRGERLEENGRLMQAYYVYERACAMASSDPTACIKLLDSGFQRMRDDACETIRDVCLYSSQRSCAVAERRCELVRSPYAGTP